MSFVN